LREFGEGLGNLEDRSDAGGVVDCAVVDLVAFQFRIAAEVVPMRAVDDAFIFLLRIAALDFPDDVVRLEVRDLVLQNKAGLRA
jgi:hypothetical protein